MSEHEVLTQAEPQGRGRQQPAPAQKAKARASGVVEKADYAALANPKGRELKGDLSGEYRVACFRIAVGPLVKANENDATEVGKHDHAYRGDKVFLSHEDALSLLRQKAVMTDAEWTAYLEAESARASAKAELDAIMATETNPNANPSALRVPGPLTNNAIFGGMI
jgi:hypothetical protein